jgi:hypothetical protein
MRSALIVMAGVVALAALVPPAAAQTAGDRADTRCLLVLGVAARDPKNKEAASRGTFYFVGRLASHGLTTKLAPILTAEAKSITSQAQAQAELQRCGVELNARTAEVQEAMQQVQQAAQAAQAAKAAAKPPT